MKFNRVVQMLRIMFVNNGYWKLFSLIIAVLVHFAIRSEISEIRVVTIPVEADFDVSNKEAAIESFVPRSVRVTLRGSYSDVNKLDNNQMSCILRPKQKPGSPKETVNLRIGSSNLRGIRGVSIVKIEPDSANVMFGVQATMKMAIDAPRVNGKARGRVELVMEQTNVVVKGSRSTLNQLDPNTARVQPEAIDVEGRSQSFTTRVKLYPPGNAQNAVVEPSEIVVNVKIISEKATVTLEQVPVMVVQPTGATTRWIVDPPVVRIEITGRSEEVKSVTFGQVVATVNGNIPITPGSMTNEVPVLLHIEQGVKVDEVQSLPESVKLIPIMETTSAVVPNGG